MSGTTLFLRPDEWDLCLDVNGNIAVASAPWQLEQDVASACRTFLGECWYNTDIGVPYFQSILGKQPSITFLASQLQAAALTVPGVVTATPYITAIQNRQATGQIQFTDSSGSTLTASF